MWQRQRGEGGAKSGKDRAFPSVWAHPTLNRWCLCSSDIISWWLSVTMASMSISQSQSSWYSASNSCRLKTERLLSEIIVVIQFSFLPVIHIVFPTCSIFCYGLLYYCNIASSCSYGRRVHLVMLIKNAAEIANWNEQETLRDKSRVRQRKKGENWQKAVVWTETTLFSSMKGFTTCTLCDVGKLNVRVWRGSAFWAAPVQENSFDFCSLFKQKSKCCHSEFLEKIKWLSFLLKKYFFNPFICQLV